MRGLDDITEAIIDSAIQIHRDLGPGLLESVYEADLPPSASPRLRVNQLLLNPDAKR